MRGVAVDGGGPLPDGDWRGPPTEYALIQCRRCGQVAVQAREDFGLGGGFDDDDRPLVLWPRRKPLGSNVPMNVRRSFDEAVRSHDAAAYTASALMSRRVVEVIAESLGAKGRNLDSQIDDLKTKGEVDARLAEWAHGIRLLGNEAAHALQASISSEDASDLILFAEALINYVYVYRAKFDEMQARRSAGSSSP